MTTKGGGGQKYPNIGPRGLWMTFRGIKWREENFSSIKLRSLEFDVASKSCVYSGKENYELRNAFMLSFVQSATY